MDARAGIEREVARLVAVEAIARLKADYARLVDGRESPREIAAMFTEDGVWDGQERFGVVRGRDELFRYFDEVRAHVTWPWHNMVAPSIEVADDLATATAHWYLWMPCTIDGRALWLAGRYEDDLVREADGQWRFRRMLLHVEALTPYERGWAAERFLGE